MSQMPYRKIAATSEIPAGKGRCISSQGKSIAVFNVDNEYCAIDEICPHKGGPLADGTVNGLAVKCPWHGAVFSLQDGSGKDGPCGNGVRRYNTRVVDKNIEIELP